MNGIPNSKLRHKTANWETAELSSPQAAICANTQLKLTEANRPPMKSKTIGKVLQLAWLVNCPPFEPDMQLKFAVSWPLQRTCQTAVWLLLIAGQVSWRALRHSSFLPPPNWIACGISPKGPGQNLLWGTRKYMCECNHLGKWGIGSNLLWRRRHKP